MPRWLAARPWRSSPIGALSGSGARVELFGAPARLPAGSGRARPRDRRANVGRRNAARRRASTGRASSEIAMPADGHAAASGSAAFMAGEVARLRARRGRRAGAVVDALLPDLGRHPRMSAPRQAAAWAAPTCTSTRSPRTACRAWPRSSTTPRTAPGSTSSRSPITSVSTPRTRRARWPRRAACARGHRRRGGHDPRRARRRAVHRGAHPAVGLAQVDRGQDPRAGRPGDHRPPARALSAVRQRPLDPAPARRSGPDLPPRRHRGVQPHHRRHALGSAGARVRRGDGRCRALAAAMRIAPSTSARH